MQLLRDIAETGRPSAWQHATSWQTEALAIVALLPKPVDPDLIEAREYHLLACGGVDCDPGLVQDVRRGGQDRSDFMQALLAAIKHGRELQKAESSNV